MTLIPIDKPYFIPDERILIQSPSRLQSYMLCARYYFYRQVLQWVREDGGVSYHLTVGTAWHKAKEYLRLHDHKQTSCNAAFDLFIETLRLEIPSEMDSQMGAKSPEVVKTALAEYCRIYDHKEYTVLKDGTEVEFTVDLGEGRGITGRLDCIAEDKSGKLWVIDDKTSTRETYNWAFSWEMKLQMIAYIFAAQCIFGADIVSGAIVEGAFFKKSGTTFNRAIVTKTKEAMAVWYYNTMRWYDLLMDDFVMLNEVDSEGSKVMQSFAMRTESCAYHYGSLCPYYEICTTFANPLNRCTNPPMGFVCIKGEERSYKGEAKKVYKDLKPTGLEAL